ncbi:MAG TPA: alpha-glucosidase [Caulobacteraceae bacterium]|jgi:alpha-glucosidase|nr:alpha-glucosidase [Caulobacteraceae bacterium]
MAGEWWRGAVVYQIYPRSFRDASGDGVGDLPGIIEKLPYVASLGVDAIWLSPFFRSPMKDFGYDVSDYQAVDPVFGTLADFDALVARSHELGLKVIIDQVWSHSSDQHGWFIESAASQDGPKSDWYVWADARADGSPPNNWQASFGGPSWTFSSQRRQYYLHNFLASQPDLNFWSEAVQDAILDTASFWLDRGVDGFRLDVVNYYVQDRELRDNPRSDWKRPPATATQFQRHIFDRSRPETLDFLGRLRALTDAYPQRMTVGEIVDPEPFARQQEYTEGADRLHTAYSFFLLLARRADPQLFAEAMRRWQGAAGWPSWSLGNHDVDRFPTRLAHDDARLVKLLLAILVCLRGTAFLYQGDELGLPQAQVPFDRLRDPFAISSYTGGSFRDGARTPFPWTPEAPSAGFSSSADTWLPLDPAHRRMSVEAQEADGGSVLAAARAAIGLRKRHAALRDGDAEVVDLGHGIFALERSLKGERLLCVFDLAGDGAELPLEGALVEALSGRESLSGGRLTLPPFGGAIVRRETR